MNLRAHSLIEAISILKAMENNEDLPTLDTRCGICEAMGELVHRSDIAKACEGWEYYTGDDTYPVAHPAYRDYSNGYHMECNVWTGEYGRRRRELAGRLVPVMQAKMGGTTMTPAKQLAKAIQVAVIAHEGQFDKGGEPYIMHPLHLMMQLLFDKELATIAVLHDVLEDSNVSVADLHDMGFTARVIRALILLTHNTGEPYKYYIDRICTNYDAIRVKRKDLEHNSDITRLKGVTQRDLTRMEKYHRAFIKLGVAKHNWEKKDG